MWTKNVHLLCPRLQVRAWIEYNSPRRKQQERNLQLWSMIHWYVVIGLYLGWIWIPQKPHTHQARKLVLDHFAHGVIIKYYNLYVRNLYLYLYLYVWTHYMKKKTNVSSPNPLGGVFLFYNFHLFEPNSLYIW